MYNDDENPNKQVYSQIGYFTQAFRKPVRTLEENTTESLQKQCDAFTRTLRWFAGDIVMKNPKARKQPGNGL
jgi:hypothetical protein